MSEFLYSKQPWESELVAVDFSRRVPSGTTISSYEVTLEETVAPPNVHAADYSPHIAIGTPALTGVTGRERILVVMVSAGITGFKYRLSYRITLSDSQRKEDDVWIIVKET